MIIPTGVGRIQAECLTNQNVMKVQQVQNSMPHISNMYGQIHQEKNAKAGARTSTIMRAGPTITGSIPQNMNENYMDTEMLFETWDQNLDNMDYFEYFEKQLNTLIDMFFEKFPAAVEVL